MDTVLRRLHGVVLTLFSALHPGDLVNLLGESAYSPFTDSRIATTLNGELAIVITPRFKQVNGWNWSLCYHPHYGLFMIITHFMEKVNRCQLRSFQANF